MKKFNNFSILRQGKLFLLALLAWLTMQPAWSQSTETAYLGFTATESGTTTVKLSKNSNPNTVYLQYRTIAKNGTVGNWTYYTIGNNINLQEGQKVEFKAGRSGYSSWTNSSFSQSFKYENDYVYILGQEEYLSGNFYYFSFSNKVEASGNVSSLLKDPEIGSITSVPDYAFAGLFQNCDKLLSAPELPGSSVALGEYCYAGMFFNVFHYKMHLIFPQQH